ncbi:MAG: serine hydrolase, partial [Planctomycetales bacterium]|nr:serine hydrolase [Planctomycetales bacterium]
MKICSQLFAVWLVCCNAGSTYAQKPEAWPAQAWGEVDPVEVGMQSDLLEDAKRYALTAGGSGLISRHGKVVTRWGDQRKRYDIKSTTKSFGATMLGVALSDGVVKLEDLAKHHYPSFGTPPSGQPHSDWAAKITLLHLATQTAGFDKPGGYEKILFEPGTQWHYSDGGPNWLAECLTLKYRRDLRDVMFERIFTPIGIAEDDLTWRKNQYRDDEIDGIKRREFGAGIHANVDALARLGFLYLREGRWRDQQLLSKSFVRFATRPVDDVIGLPEWDGGKSQGNASDQYGLLWWTNADGSLRRVPRDAYWAWGLYDSLII